MICAYAAKAEVAYNYCRGEFWELTQVLESKVQQLNDRGLLGDRVFDTDYSLQIHHHLGAGAYICGEESALLESIEGKLGQPRLKPPFPADRGLYQLPTVVNNTETLTNVPLIISRGPEWYQSIGTEKSCGPKIMCLSGHAKHPGNYETPLGITFRELIFDLAGGVRDDKKLKAIMPSGASAPILSASDEVLDTPLTYEDIPKIGSQLGSASIILLDETVDISWAVLKTMKFFEHESCGKCTPCREGTYWMYHLLDRINSDKAEQVDVDLLGEVAQQVVGKCLCPLGDFATSAVFSGIELFQADFDLHIPNAVSDADDSNTK